MIFPTLVLLGCVDRALEKPFVVSTWYLVYDTISCPVFFEAVRH